MPKFTIERQYLLPVYVHDTVEAPDAETAMRQSIESDDWEHQKEDYESARATYITGAWEGEEAYPEGGRNLGDFAIPPEFQGEEERARAEIDQLRAAGESKPIKIVVVVEDGLVSAIVSDGAPIESVTVDYDVDNDSDDYAADIPQSDGTTLKGFIGGGVVDVDAAFVTAVHAMVENEGESE